MSALRTMSCPKCGGRHLIGHPCPSGSSQAAGTGAREPSLLMRFVVTLVITLGCAGLLSLIALAVMERSSVGAGVAVVVIAWLVMSVLRLGYEYDDGIDVMRLLLPAPFDWNVKIERMVHFWTSPGVWFRAVYLGTVLALVIVMVVAKRR